MTNLFVFSITFEEHFARMTSDNSKIRVLRHVTTNFTLFRFRMISLNREFHCHFLLTSLNGALSDNGKESQRESVFNNNGLNASISRLDFFLFLFCAERKNGKKTAYACFFFVEEKIPIALTNSAPRRPFLSFFLDVIELTDV